MIANSAYIGRYVRKRIDYFGLIGAFSSSTIHLFQYFYIFFAEPGTATNLQLSSINGTNNLTSELALSWQTPNSFPWQQYRIILKTTINTFVISELYFPGQYLTPVTFQTQLNSLTPAVAYTATVVILNQFFGTNITGDESQPSNLQNTGKYM